MEGLVPLLLTAGLGGGFLYAAKRKEGFSSLVDPPVDKATGPATTYMTESGANKFNPIMNLTDPQNNPFFPRNASQNEISSKNQQVKQALGSVIASPTMDLIGLKLSDTSIYDITQSKGGQTLEQIRMCEKLKSSSCDAFNNPKFAEVCGVCHEGGRDSGGNATLGGLFIAEDDKLNARESAGRMKASRVTYMPSVGQCAPGRFTVNKAQCVRMQKQLECEKKQNFDVPGCSQCFQDERFYFVDDQVTFTYPSIVLVGEGQLSASFADEAGKPTTLKRALSSSATRIAVPTFKEGDILELNISAGAGAGAAVKVAGYLEGRTATGNFTMDIVRLIQSDLESGAKPRVTGFQTVDEIDISLIRPAAGKSVMRLPIRNVFTFVAADQVESTYCAAAPILQKASSAEFLNSGPCYKKGQAPGKYSLDCLQDMFVNAGCTIQGEGYPSNTQRANALMRGSRGELLNVAQIAGKVYEASQTAFSGQQGGKKLTIPEWDQVSRFCTGKRLNNPCDTDNKDAGPLSADCLSYLWQNAGATDTKPGALGATYMNSIKTTSLNGKQVRYCTPAGTMAPINAQGQYNQTAIAAAQKAGGVDAVKAMYNRIHASANDNTQSDQGRKAAIEQCYGVTLEPLPDATLPGSPSGPATSCVPQTVIPQLIGGSGAKVHTTTAFKPNWILNLAIQPSAVSASNAFDSILLFTGTGSDAIKFGDRVLGIWFWPGTNRLHVSLSTDKNANWSINTDKSLPLNKVTNVSVSCTDGKITLKCTGALTEELTQDFPSTMFNGTVKLVSPSPSNPSFKGTATNVSFCTFESNTRSVLDYAPGRTKSTLQRNNYAPMDWSRFSRPAVVLGNYGMQPWGTWWASGFPANVGAKWIWTFAGANNNEPNWDWRQFYYRYTNSTNGMIVATLTVAADNKAMVYLNDGLVGSSSGNVTRFQVSFPPGESKLQINAANMGGPAGLCVVAQDASRVLFVSDERWTIA